MDSVVLHPDRAPTPQEVIAVARSGATVRLSDDALGALARGRAAVEALADRDDAVYGVSTGFGALATRHIKPAAREQLQRSLIRSHAAGSGPLVEVEVVRAMALLRLRTLVTGATGVRPVVATLLAELLNAGITPAVHEYGSLGCSGDLAPLAHVALVLMGEGQVVSPDGVGPAGPALAAAGLEPVTLQAKEGLALINGTDGMLGMLLLAIADLNVLLPTADITAAMSLEALLGTDRVFADDLQVLRPHPGQRASATNMRGLLADSAIVASHRTPDCTRVQDAYSLRCSPQVHGAVRDTIAHAERVAAIELGSTIDNPVVMDVAGRDAGEASSAEASARVESNGNFHGAPVGYVLDFLAIAVADAASIAERRTDRLLDRARSQGLPPFLADDPGVDSGLMIAQYTQAGLVNELKRLAVPASVDSIPSSGMQEDHVSMGWNAARKLRRSIDGLAQVLAVEALAAARALDLRAPLDPSPATGAARDAVRTIAEGPGPDRFLAPEIAAVTRLVTSGRLRSAVAAVIDLV